MKKVKFKIVKYVSEIKDEIIELLDYENKTILFESPTGTGKTTLISEIFKTNDCYNNLTCPNRIQVLQNKSLNLKSVIGKAKYNFILDENVCCVFDKINEYISFLKEYIEIIEKNNYNKILKINFVLDEAHMLVLGYEYRKRSIDSILELIKLLKSSKYIKSNIIFMSATCDCLKFLDFDLKIKVEKEFKIYKTEKYKTKKYNIKKEEIKKYKVKKSKIKKSNVEQFIVKSYKYKSKRKSFKEFILKELIDNKEQCFIRYNDKKGTKELIDSLEKEFNKTCTFINSDEKDFKIVNDKIVYNNFYYGEIIQNKNLPKDKQYIFTTSLLDVGTSIEKGNENLTLYFIVDKSHQMILDNLLQFINRCRYKIEKCVILINNYYDTTNFKTFNDIYNSYLKEVKKRQEMFNVSISALENKNYSKDDIEEMFSLIKTIKNCFGVNEKYKMLDYDKESNSVNINYIYLNLLSYLEFCKIDFYNQSRFVKRLEKKTNSKITYIEIDELNQIKFNKFDKTERNITFNEVIKIAEILNKKEKDQLNNLDKLENINLSLNIQSILKNKFFKECIDTCNKFKINTNDFLEFLISNKLKKDCKDWIYKQQIIFYNLLFSDTEDLKVIGILEQQIIVRMLYNKLLKKQIIKQYRIEEITKTLNAELKTNIYNSDLVIKYIKLIFVYEENDKFLKIKQLRKNLNNQI